MIQIATSVLLATTMSAAAFPTATSDTTIPEVAVASGRLDTLVAAVKAAGLAEALSGEGPFTVFAPTDAAFSRLGEDTLVGLLEPGQRETLGRILKHHVLAGRFDAARLVGMSEVETLAGTTLPLEVVRGRLLVGDAAVETADVDGGNGVVHLIDRVLLPPRAVSPLETLIENAVNRGAPIFNDGDTASCAAIYATALEAAVLTDGFGIDAGARRRIAARLDEIAAMADTREQAWSYRRIMDSLFAAASRGEMSATSAASTAPAAAPAAARSTPSESGRTIFAFDRGGEADAWYTVVDGVMGGRSTGRIAAGEGTLVFDGATSLENNGGFSSMRVDLPAGRFEGFDAVKLRVKGDGREYRLGAKASRGAGAGGYWAPFATERGEWIDVVVPIATLERHFMGQRLPGRLDPNDLRTLEFYIYDKKAGPFRLEIDSIEAVRMKDQPFDA